MERDILITIGVLFLVGLCADLIGRHTPLPRVTLLLLAGVLAGPSVLDWLPAFTQDWFPLLTDLALAMIGFLLGQKMSLSRLRDLGRVVLSISVGEVLVTALLVFGVLVAFGVRVEVALLLAGVAPASAPAATVDVVREARARGVFTDTLLGVVAVDDAWGLILFSLLLAAAEGLTGGGGAAQVVVVGLWEVGGAVLLGVALGVPMALLTGRLTPGEPTQAEALGFVLLCAGLAAAIGVSFILAAMVLGSAVANLARHHQRAFHAIEGIEWPFLVLFFLLAGASFHVGALAEVGLLGAAYVVLRPAGLTAGGWLGGWLAGAPEQTRRWIGPTLLPQAGVALGMALIVGQRFPDLEHVVLPIVLGSTVLFELLGPVVTRYALVRVGESARAGKGARV